MSIKTWLQIKGTAGDARSPYVDKVLCSLNFGLHLIIIYCFYSCSFSDFLEFVKALFGPRQRKNYENFFPPLTRHWV